MFWGTSHHGSSGPGDRQPLCTHPYTLPCAPSAVCTQQPAPKGPSCSLDPEPSCSFHTAVPVLLTLDLPVVGPQNLWGGEEGTSGDCGGKRKLVPRLQVLCLHLQLSRGCARTDVCPAVGHATTHFC